MYGVPTMHYSGDWGYSNNTDKNPSSSDTSQGLWTVVMGERQILGALTSSWATAFPIENQKLLLCGLKRRVGHVARDLMTTVVTSQCWHVAGGGCSRGVRWVTSPEQEGTVPTVSGHQEGRCDGRLNSCGAGTFRSTPGPIASSLSHCR